MREAELTQEIDDLLFDAWRRRELHDDPVGAKELEELAAKKTAELQKLYNLEEVKQ